MKPVLVLYATREGQTRRIAEHVAERVCAHGLAAHVMNVADQADSVDLQSYQAAVLAASVHAGKHEREMVRFVETHLPQLQQIPTVFLSTSLTETSAEDPTRSEEVRARAHADVERLIEQFFTQTGWRATVHKPIAGALRYSQYGWLVRQVMKQISKRAGGDTDTSRDHEYTNWTDLARFVDAWVESDFSSASL